MVKFKILIDGEPILDDDNDVKEITNFRCTKTTQDEIGEAIINTPQSVDDIVNLQTGKSVEMWKGYNSADEERFFYGSIAEINGDEGYFEIVCKDRLWLLAKKNVNFVYDAETHITGGVVSEIAKDIIETFVEMDAQVVHTGDAEDETIDEFKSIHSSAWERLNALKESVDYQIRYDDHNDVVHFEPRGYEDSGKTIKVGQEIINFPDWDRDSSQIINQIRIDGATSETDITETGTIGTDEGWDTDGIELEKTPNVVELIVDGEQKEGGSKDSSVDHYFWVDRENKKVMPTEGTTFPTSPAVVNYSWSAPSPIQMFNEDSIQKMGGRPEGIREKQISLTDISSVSDAEARGKELLAKYSKGLINGNINVINVEGLELKTGQRVRVIDNINEPNIDRGLVIWRRVITYSEVEEMEVGDKQDSPEDYLKSASERIKRLEEENIRNDDLVVQLIQLEDEGEDNAVFPKERYIKVFEKNIGGDVGIWGNEDFGVWGVMKWGSEADQSFILGKSKLGLNALGSITSEDVLKVVKSFEEYYEDFSDEDFKDEDSDGWANLTDTQEAISTSITYNEKEIETCNLTTDYDGNVTFYLDNGNGWEEWSENPHNFSESGDRIKWKGVSSGISEIKEVKITY